MISCCCSLAGTKACDTCSAGPSQGGYTGFNITWPLNHGLKTDGNMTIDKPKEKQKRITEKFDKDGKLIERITEDV